LSLSEICRLRLETELPLLLPLLLLLPVFLAMIRAEPEGEDYSSSPSCRQLPVVKRIVGGRRKKVQERIWRTEAFVKPIGVFSSQ
jgi:hypothetical protein